MNFEGILGLIQKYLFRFSLSRIGITDIVEIIIISVIVYQIIKWLQLTRAWTLFKGIIVLLLFALAAVIFQLDTIAWLLSNSLSVGIMAAIVIFQPELRRALEQLGRKNFFRTFIFSSEDEGTEKTFLTEKAVTEIVRAVFEMSKVKTGALIVIEQKVALGEYERTGIAVDGIVSSQLLINIFEHNTPLHDGAVIIRGSRVVSATCYLPLTDSMELGKELGTRHRAAVGISEVSDSTTIVVSEETGAVSVAREGRLSRNLTRDELKERLNLLRPESTGSMDVLKKWKGLLRNERPEKPAKNKEQ
ncbi:MAG: diadenylate cyclase CdaA [Clostridiales bacterium]|uniref:Diadenylate cyclase n=1 Tax=Candidatus Anaerobutyricum stercoripullorum TaxID=2838456 RepID=A0A9D2BF90_9FIRM|nr:diadenylate cyclase CdaA [Clostridiales bacterium]HIX73094.1 diadenylate cyclase CdaA [Candidatus Anaerobutyricum stercoripullorum]